MRTIAAFALTFALTSTALAGRCPMEMAAIDDALPTADLTEAERERVEELRAEGEEQHEAGNHAESVAALDEAKEILGI